MATRMTTECDVYPSKKEVFKYRLTLERRDVESDTEHTRYVLEPDLSIAGFERLVGKIERGVHPPGWNPPEKPKAASSETPTEPTEEAHEPLSAAEALAR